MSAMAQAQLEDDGEGLDIDVYWASPRPVMRIELVGDTDRGGDLGHRAARGGRSRNL